MKDRITSEQMRAARQLLNWKQTDLVEASGVSISTIKKVEVEKGPIESSRPIADAIQRAFEAAGVEFIGEGVTVSTGGAGVRLK